MPVEVRIENIAEIEKYLLAMPEDTKKQLRLSANRAGEAAHREALIQISRNYTIGMAATEKDLHLTRAKSDSIVSILWAKGRPRGARNFNITPFLTPSSKKGASSKSGYSVEIEKGNRRKIKKYFWLQTAAGPHLFRYVYENGKGKRGGKIRKGYRIFKTISVPQMLENENVGTIVGEVTLRTLEDTFARGMTRIIERGAVR